MEKENSSMSIKSCLQNDIDTYFVCLGQNFIIYAVDMEIACKKVVSYN